MPRQGGVPENLKPFKKGDDPRRNLKGNTKPNLDEILSVISGDDLKDMILSLIKKGKKGDLAVIREILDRLYGKPKNIDDFSGEVTIKVVYDKKDAGSKDT